MTGKTEQVESRIRVSMSGHGGIAFCKLLDNAGIEYTRHRPPLGVPFAGGEWVTVAPSFITALGAVLAAWVLSRKNRAANISDGSHPVFHIHIHATPEQIANALKPESRVIVTDPNRAEE